MTTPNSTTADLNESASTTLQGNGSGSVPNPVLGNAFAVANVQPGSFTINWTVTLAGTLGANDANNFQLYIASGGHGTLIAQSVNASAAGSYPQTPVVVNNVPQGAIVYIAVGPNNPTFGSTYSGTVNTPGWGIVKLSPYGTRYSGYTWQPSMLYVSVAPAPGNSGVVNEAQAIAYVSYGVYSAQPTDAIGQTQTGSTGDTCGMTQTLKPNDWLTVFWSGGDVGGLATARLTGSVNVPIPSVSPPPSG